MTAPCFASPLQQGYMKKAVTWCVKQTEQSYSMFVVHSLSHNSLVYSTFAVYCQHSLYVYLWASFLCPNITGITYAGQSAGKHPRPFASVP